MGSSRPEMLQTPVEFRGATLAYRNGLGKVAQMDLRLAFRRFVQVPEKMQINDRLAVDGIRIANPD